jgi:hypothetical protein
VVHNDSVYPQKLLQSHVGDVVVFISPRDQSKIERFYNADELGAFEYRFALGNNAFEVIIGSIQSKGSSEPESVYL